MTSKQESVLDVEQRQPVRQAGRQAERLTGLGLIYYGHQAFHIHHNDSARRSWAGVAMVGCVFL